MDNTTVVRILSRAGFGVEAIAALLGTTPETVVAIRRGFAGSEWARLGTAGGTGLQGAVGELVVTDVPIGADWNYDVGTYRLGALPDQSDTRIFKIELDVWLDHPDPNSLEVQINGSAWGDVILQADSAPG